MSPIYKILIAIFLIISISAPVQAEISYILSSIQDMYVDNGDQVLIQFTITNDNPAFSVWCVYNLNTDTSPQPGFHQINPGATRTFTIPTTVSYKGAGYGSDQYTIHTVCYSDADSALVRKRTSFTIHYDETTSEPETVIEDVATKSEPEPGPPDTTAGKAELKSETTKTPAPKPSIISTISNWIKNIFNW